MRGTALRPTKGSRLLVLAGKVHQHANNESDNTIHEAECRNEKCTNVHMPNVGGSGVLLKRTEE